MISGSAFPRYARNVSGRDFAVGDIHGCFSHLSRSLEAIGFDASADRLFSVGDLVDRGLESDRVLEWLAKDWFHAICGNHDLMAYQAALGLVPDTGYLQIWGEWLAGMAQSEQQLVGEALAALPLTMEIETSGGSVGLVHADCPFDDWRDMQRVPWPIDPIGPVGDCCLWSMERYRRNYSGKVRNVRALVHGHVVTAAPKILGNVHFIDTGGWRPGGYFTFLELETMKPVFGPRAEGAALNLRNR